MSHSGPIGVFDSGVGGLSVLKEIRGLLPAEDVIYFADSAYCPYGGRLPEVIQGRALAIGRFLVEKGAKLIVVASNTTSASGLDALRDCLSIPIVGVEPAVKPAAAQCKQGKVGVLATVVTLASERFSSLLDRFCDDVEVITQPCPGLVEVVEAGQFDEAKPLLTKYLQPLLDQGCETIVLGCTHYPLLYQQIREMAGPNIKIIDSGKAVARQVQRVLNENQLETPENQAGSELFFTSGDPETVGPVIDVIWGKHGVNVERVAQI
ncbi:MAG TPA: glutamate racemase [Desulfobacteria bacterium]|nr:glutamate racemase [Desulfobacteria bacterium]